MGSAGVKCDGAGGNDEGADGSDAEVATVDLAHCFPPTTGALTAGLARALLTRLETPPAPPLVRRSRRARLESGHGPALEISVARNQMWSLYRLHAIKPRRQRWR